MENKKNAQFNMDAYKKVIEALGNPNGLLEMISYIESLNTKSEGILDFSISRTKGVSEVEDMDESAANEIIENCKKEIPELEEILEKAIEYRTEYEKKYCIVTEDNAFEMLSNMICIMFDCSIASAEATVIGSGDLIKYLESNKENMRLTHTYPSATPKAE